MEVGGYFLIEHPEDLGLVAEESPASFWQLDEMRQLQLETRATTWAIFQCAFDAGSPKPTRFLSNLRRCSTLKYASWPRFDSCGRYLGPLPFSCGHRFHVKKLIGKSKDGSWTTSPAAAYPPALCQYLASLIATAARCKEVDRSAESSGSVEKNFGCKFNDSGEDITSSKIVDIAQDVPVKNADAAHVASHAMNEFDTKATGNNIERVQTAKEVSSFDGGRTVKSYGNWGSFLSESSLSCVQLRYLQSTQ